MQVDVIFGSQSDNQVFDPLCHKLSKIEGVQVNFEVCSAHRDPERLRKLIADSQADLFIAGAGLAAHLPGVVASQTSKPVIGIPCNDVLDGMDALLSTIQMPKGVPVMTAGIGKASSVVKFVEFYAAHREQPPVIYLSCPPWAGALIKTLKEPLEAIGWEFVYHVSEVDHPPAMFAVVLADLFMPLPTVQSTWPGLKSGVWLGAPVYVQSTYSGDLRVFEKLTNEGGLWVGVNNITNIQLSLLKLWCVGKDEKTLMEELSKGVVPSAK
jgi:phosphoribosylaminoimidazole carboxylase PurE protein